MRPTRAPVRDGRLLATSFSFSHSERPPLGSPTARDRPLAPPSTSARALSSPGWLSPLPARRALTSPERRTSPAVRTLRSPHISPLLRPQSNGKIDDVFANVDTLRTNSGEAVESMGSGMTGVSDENITVVVRTRPMTCSEQTELSRPDNAVIVLDEQAHSVTLKPTVAATTSRVGLTGPYSFKYDHVLPGHCGQARVFDIVGRQACEHFLDGYNVAIFAYGHTGAGKTYTMYGKGGVRLSSSSSSSSSSRQLSEDDGEEAVTSLSHRDTPHPEISERERPHERERRPHQEARKSDGSEARISDGSEARISEFAGLVPRCLCFIFAKIRELRARNCEVIIKVSFIEIYNETVMDLLSHNPRLMNLREDALNDRVFVEGVLEAKVESLEEVVHLLNTGEQNRTTGSTAANAQSSRSHSVFTISLEASSEETPSSTPSSRAATAATATSCGRRRLLRHSTHSQFRLVDLAGSERQKHSKAQGKHLREASNINRSLTVLGKVIMALASGSKHVPYRDSKLTFLLKNSLGGNSRTFLIANIAEAASVQDESLSTLKFASFARTPLMHVSKNVVHADVSIQELQNQVLLLKAQLQRSSFTEEVQQQQQQGGSLRGSGTTSPKLRSSGTTSPKLRSSGTTSPTHNSHHAPDDLLDSMSGMRGVCGQLSMCGQLWNLDAVKTGSEYVGHLQVSLERALEREKSLRSKLARERHEFLTKLEEYDWLCKSLEQCLESSKRIIQFKDIKIRDLREGGGGGAAGQGSVEVGAAVRLPTAAGGGGGGSRNSTTSVDSNGEECVLPEVVRARITIRALEEELSVLRGAEKEDLMAERDALLMDVTQLTEQVQVLLVHVRQLEAQAAAHDKALNTLRLDYEACKAQAEDCKNATLEKDAAVVQLQERLHALSMALEEEKRAHISVLELVQELREAEEEWATQAQEADAKIAAAREEIVLLSHQLASVQIQGGNGGGIGGGGGSGGGGCGNEGEDWGFK